MLSWQNMGGFDHATIFCPSFHGLRTETAMQMPRQVKAKKFKPTVLQNEVSLRSENCVNIIFKLP